MWLKWAATSIHYKTYPPKPQNLALGHKESYQNWLDFLREMVKRGRQTPVLITSDGAPGLIRAIEAVFAHSLRQRCLAHKIRHVLAKVPGPT